MCVICNEVYVGGLNSGGYCCWQVDRDVDGREDVMDVGEW